MPRSSFSILGKSLSALLLAILVAPIAAETGPPSDADSQTTNRLPCATTTDWPMGRGGPARTGAAAFALAPPLKRIWTFDAGRPIESGPAVVDDAVYVGAISGDFFALKAADGSRIWTHRFEGGAPVGAPAVDCENVYVCTDDGSVHALDRETGKPAWCLETESEVQSGPTLAGDRLYVGSYDQHLYAIERLTGRQVWRFAADGPVHGAPTIAEGHAFIAGCDHMLRAVELTSPTQTWQLEMAGFSSANPALSSGTLYVGHFAGAVVAARTGNGEIVWEFKTESDQYPIYAPCAVAPNLVIAASRDKNVYGIDRATGDLAWKQPVGAEVDAPPVLAGDTVYVGAKNGRLFALDVTTGEVRWEYVTGASILGGPALARQRLFLGDTSGVLYCFGPETEP